MTKETKETRNPGSQVVSAGTLLQGAWFALEQCGLFLRDAHVIYDIGRYSTASALALHAMEELGRHVILLGLWERSDTGADSFTPDDVREACGDHVPRQRRAQLSLRSSPQLRALGDAALEAIRKYPRQPGDERPHPERQRANEAIEQYVKGTRKRIPHDREAARRRALYVDVNELGTGWNRPNRFSQEEARGWVNDATYEYLGPVGFLQETPDLLASLHPRLAAALESWPERPRLPGPPLPKDAQS